MRHDITLFSRSDFDSREYMRCRKCGSTSAGVFETSAAGIDGTLGIGRSRKCKKCGYRWRTIEVTVEVLDAHNGSETVDNLRNEIRKLKTHIKCAAANSLRAIM